MTPLARTVVGIAEMLVDANDTVSELRRELNETKGLVTELIEERDVLLREVEGMRKGKRK